ncbi:MAG: aminotransferase class I/II-fold pyridoxal phosphate-dependent enzyme [Bryobacterales bacterium]|nr:aminotransferase class I/II-fold pyridoxal phosphate-dependent enzyme [Bryobacterales bacterium]
MPIKRLPMRESVIRGTTILSAQLGAVNLSQGFSDEDTFPEIKQLAIDAIGGSYHQYTNPWGSPILREALARKLAAFNGLQVDPERHIVVTCGATEGMIVAMEALVERGSDILCFAPMYENYVLQAIAAGVNIRTVEVREPDFTFTRDELDAAWTPGMAAIILCNPGNPTGKVLTPEELETVAAFAADRDLLIFADETYEYLVWPGHRHVSIGTLPAAKDRTVTVTSMGKTYSVTGWRVGYLVAHESLTDELRKMHDFHTVTAPHPFQVALARALDLPESFYQRLRDEYWARKEILCEGLAAAGMRWYEPGGSYFLWCDYAALSGDDDDVFAERLMREGGVAGVAGSVFYPNATRNPKRIRFTFSKSRQTVEEASRRLRRL